MKTKKSMKRLFSVIAVLCFLFGAAAAALAEETAEVSLPTICLYNFSDDMYEVWEYDLSTNLGVEVINSFDFPEGKEVWLVSTFIEPRSTSVLPDNLPQELYFSNSTFIPSTLDVDEATGLWLDVVVNLAKNGKAVHLYTHPKVEPNDYFTAKVYRNVYDRLAELAETPEESGIAKSAEKDNCYVVSTDDPEVSGYITTSISEGTNRYAAEAAAVMDVEYRLWYMLYPELNNETDH